jgi:anthranilate phosphoribosyltransferase
MSDAFRDLLRKVGSGPHTSENLSRAEAAAATAMMLRQEATLVQIGAFMIAHRIKRPTGEELAGMLDAYDQLGPKLAAVEGVYQTVVMGIPYDGRSRTAPISPVTALLLTTVGCPVVMHGGRRMPTKAGVPLVELWQELGLDWTGLRLDQVQQVFQQTGLGFVYLPSHFPLAEALVPFREQLGKRPPFATAELFWSPYAGEALIVSGFVHPPTEEMARLAFGLRGTGRFMTVKGLEGSLDLPRDRTCIVGLNHISLNHPGPEPNFERLLLHPRDYGFAAPEVPLSPTPELAAGLQTVLQGQPSSLFDLALWNGGFYLWQCGHCPDLEAGITEARALLLSGRVAQKLQDIQATVQQIGQSPLLETVPS